MKLVLVSPEQPRADEGAVVEALFAVGLERYHIRKPHASLAELEAWIQRLSPKWRGRLILHQHHPLVASLGLGGYHWKDDRDGVSRVAPRGGVVGGGPAVSPYLRSRSCHDLATLRTALGAFDSVFFGPVFPSISKPGYGPKDVHVGEALGAVLLTRSARERGTSVIAIGGITSETAPRARELGFDGVAVLGAIWQAADPVAAFVGLQASCRSFSEASGAVAAGVN